MPYSAIKALARSGGRRPRDINVIPKARQAGSCLAFGFALCVALSAARAVEQPALPPAAPPAQEQDLKAADVEALRKGIAELPGLDEALRTATLARYDEALKYLLSAEDWRTKDTRFDQLREEAPAETERLKGILAQPLPQEPFQAPESATLAELDQQLAAAEAAYKEVQAEFDQLMKEPGLRSDRRNQIPGLLTSARQRLQEAEGQLTAAPVASEAAELQTAGRTAARARVASVRAEIAAYEKELLCYDARNAVLGLRQEEGKRRLAEAERAYKGLQEATARRRREEAAKAAELARQVLAEITRANPAIRQRAQEVAERNAALAEQRTGAQGLTRRIEEARAELESVSAELKQVDEERNRIIERVKAGGLNSAIGVMLRKQKSQLPSVRRLRRSVRERRPDIAEVQLAQSELREQRLNLADAEQDIRRAIEAVPDQYTSYERKEIEDVIAQLLQDQRGLIEALERDYDSYLNVLFELTAEEEQLAQHAEDFADYINENILWIGGTNRIGMHTLADAAGALRWLTAGEAWGQFPELLHQRVRRQPLPFLALFLTPVAWLLLRRRLRTWLEGVGEHAQSKRETRFGPTVEACALTVLWASFGPTAVALLGLGLSVSGEAVDPIRTVGQGITATAFIWFCIEVLRQAFRTGGLGEAHFGWASTQLRRARRTLGTLMITVWPAAFLVFTFDSQTDEAWKDAIGRLAFSVAMIAFAVALNRLLRLARLAMRDTRRSNWFVDRYYARMAVYIVVSGMPLALAVLAMTGYYFTALHLAYRFFWSLLLVIVAGLTMATVRRWLLVTRRALAIEQTRRRREAAKAEAAGEGQAEAEIADTALDLVKIDSQTQNLVRSVAVIAVVFGMWFIWVDVVPALRVFDEMQLWSITVTVEEQVPNDAGEMELSLRPELLWITAADLGLCIVVLILTLVAVRNLPGLLEILLLQRLGLGAGERYATLAITRYVLMGLGIVIAFRAIGIGWSSVQWLVAAVSVGLGFGLQEIFANFVSGLILLFERPIRVGDTVTIGNVSGQVAQIRIRATTITDWDRKELIVPNKEFVTGQLINWTLSDNVLRVIVPVGVAYGSDTGLVLETLLRVAREHPLVLEDPSPQVFFLGFGASSLDFELRVFSPDVDSFLKIKHDMHMAVDQAFRKAGIEIAFPQQDVHVRSGFEKLMPPSEGAGEGEHTPG